MTSRLRPRSTSELIDALFELLRGHYLSFLTIVAVGFAPAAVIGTVAAVAGAFDGVFGTGTSATAVGPAIAAIAVVVAVAVGCLVLVQGALVYAASDAYLDDVVDVASAFRRSASNVPMMLVAYLLTGLTTIVGYLLFIVPGLYLAAGLFAVPAIVLLEERGPAEAMERSMSLTKGRKLAVLGALFVTGLIAGVLRMSLGAAGSAGGAGLGLAMQIAAYVAMYPMTTIMAVLLYYDARIRSEGFDIERAAASLGTRPPTA